MRICFLIRSLELAGAETQLVLLANGLAVKGHDVSVVVFYPDGPLEKFLKGVRLIHVPKKNRWDVSFLFELRRVLKGLAPDIVHGFLGLGNILAALMKPLHRAPALWGVRASHVDLDFYGYGEKLSFYIEKLMSHCVDGIIINSFAGKEYAASIGYPVPMLEVIHNGIDTERYSPTVEGRMSFRREFGIDDSACLFGLVGRVDPMKGHDVFIAASERIAAEVPHARFVCVGRADGAFADEMKRLSAGSSLGDRLVWAGQRQDMRDVFCGIDVLVSASRFGEGFPNVVGEAMACGTPCIVTDVGDSLVVIGDTGSSVPPDNAEALSDAMLAMVNRVPVENDIVRGRICDEFSVEKMIENTEKHLLKRMRQVGA